MVSLSKGYAGVGLLLLPLFLQHLEDGALARLEPLGLHTRLNAPLAFALGAVC